MSNTAKKNEEKELDPFMEFVKLQSKNEEQTPEKEQFTATMTVKLTPEQKDFIKLYAEGHNQTVSEWVRFNIDKLLKEYRKAYENTKKDLNKSGDKKEND